MKLKSCGNNPLGRPPSLCISYTSIILAHHKPHDHKYHQVSPPRSELATPCLTLRTFPSPSPSSALSSPLLESSTWTAPSQCVSYTLLIITQPAQICIICIIIGFMIPTITKSASLLFSDEEERQTKVKLVTDVEHEMEVHF